MQQSNIRPLDETRAEITAIDREIQALFLRRMACAEQVAAYKLTTGDSILKPDREQYLIQTLGAQAPAGLRQEYTALLKSVMRVSRKHQYEFVLACQPERLALPLTPRQDKPARVAYQGLPASYQSQAARAMFPDAQEIFHVPTFEDVFRAVSAGQADAGVVPAENSTVGTINEACDLLVQYDLHISHSHVDHIQNCLCALPGATLASVRTACSIKPALGQCQNFLKAHGLAQREAENTAVAAQTVAQSGDLTLAAVCSEQAAALYGLSVLARGINDDKHNQTRFIAVSRGLSAQPDDNRISLVFTLPHRDGSLAAALSVCADHEINLTEIHSRPLPETPWEYRFYIDLEGSLCDPAVRAMIYQLEEELSTVRILGSYRISDSTEGEVTSL